MRMPAVDGFAFHIVARGSSYVRPFGESAVRLSQGDICLLPTGEEHDVLHHPDAEPHPVDSVVRKYKTIHASASNCMLMSGIFRVDRGVALRVFGPEVRILTPDKAVAGLVGLLVAECQDRGPGFETSETQLLNALFVRVARSIAMDADCQTSCWLRLLAVPGLVAAVEGMHRSPAAPWTVETLARVAGMSRATFARRFNDVVGEPPLSYLTAWRMIVAAKLLRERDASVAQVAKDVGYDSAFAFSRAFKRHSGSAPSISRRITVDVEDVIEIAQAMGPDADRGFVTLFDATKLGALAQN